MSEASELISQQQNFINDLLSGSSSAIQNALSVTSYAPTPITYTPNTPPSPPPSALTLAVPAFDLFNLDLPPEPSAPPEFEGLPERTAGTVPNFTDTAPTIRIGTKPSQMRAFSEVAPVVNTDFGFPTLPTVLENPDFTMPTTGTYTAPVKPQLTLPSFDAVAPSDMPVAPTGLPAQLDRDYSGQSVAMISMVNGYMDAQLLKINPRYYEQMGRIEDQLSKYLDGGTGLKAEVEDAIYSRARAKNDVEARRVIDSAAADAAARGFTLPNGALVAATARARQEASNNNAKTATDIAVAQAEMEQKNLQFAVTTSAALRATAIQATLSYMQGLTTLNGQALDFAKMSMSAVIEAYNASVKAFEFKLEAYKTAASVYDIKMRAALATIELYKSEIQAMEAMVNVDRAKVDMYKTRIEALNTYANLYKTQVDAVVSKASLEKLKIDAFQARVSAYATEVQGKNSEWQAYEAEINGEIARAKVFATQVDAFNGKVSAYRALSEVDSERIRAVIQKNDANSRQYLAKLSQYEASVRAKALVVGANADSERQKLTGFQAQIQLGVANARLAGDYYNMTSQVGIATSKGQLEAAIQNAVNALATMRALSEVHRGILEVYSKPATAAAAGMNSLASINASE